MRSLSRGAIAGNFKLRGKRSLLLGCGCCILQNLKPDYEVQEAEKEIQNYKKEIPEEEWMTIGLPSGED